MEHVKKKLKDHLVQISVHREGRLKIIVTDIFYRAREQNSKNHQVQFVLKQKIWIIGFGWFHEKINEILGIIGFTDFLRKMRNRKSWSWYPHIIIILILIILILVKYYEMEIKNQYFKILEFENIIRTENIKNIKIT